jgi:methylenetetrahydrofolate--tRNA-(uracil-5-)-methyltransferase
MEPVTVIGAGLAGSECAVQLARRGIPVRLCEMKPLRRSPAHRMDGPAELVCSNSFRSDSPETPIGILHAELRQLGSVILGEADRCRVPAGEALAVDRDRFSAGVDRALSAAPGLVRVVAEVEALPAGDVVVATGPLTSEALTRVLSRWTGDKLYFYDYLNLPLDEAGYRGFVREVLAAEKVAPHAFEEPRYFEGCLPIEVMAERGEETLAHGPMKPVGLVDPRTGRRPYAVVQLRQEDVGGTAYNLVGFQTRLTWPEQRRVFRTLPGLQDAEFLRMGQIHRNTFIDAPRLLGPDLSLQSEPRVWFAGQISGVEGYVESAASGYLVALAVAARRQGRRFVPPPGETALGALYRHVMGAAHPPGTEYQPSNVTFGLFPPLPGRVPKSGRREAHAARARTSLSQWIEFSETSLAPSARTGTSGSVDPAAVTR